MTSESLTIIDFNLTKENKSLAGNWQVVGDNIMGGKSTGTFEISNQNTGVFKGAISVQNNGGFSLVRYQFEKTKVLPKQKILLRIKGDGKKYQFRIKTHSEEKHAYVFNFPTSGGWETLVISLPKMQAKYRGRKLDIPNFNFNHLQEIGFLIGNKKAENYRLEISRVYLE